VTRRVALGGLLVLAVVVGAYLSAARRTEGPPLDPTSTAPDGARALVELLDRYGDVDVRDRPPDRGQDTAVLLEDRFDREAEAALRSWVEAGGTLLVADPGSTLTPAMASSTPGLREVSCDDPALAAVRQLPMGGTGFALDVPDGATTCATPDGAAVVVVDGLGSGRIVSLGGPAPLTNRRLDEGDAAVLAVALLAPEAGTDVAFLQPELAVGSGDRSLTDLVGTPVRAALAQLGVAFCLVVLWRARRLGRPVAEPQPVQIESAELTAAVGRMLARSRQPGRAAAILRDRARRDLSGRLGLPLDAPADLVVDAITARTGLDPAEARRAATGPVTSDDDLVEVAALLVRIREEITHGPAPREHRPTVDA
jgi:hypothetical protein